MCLDRGGGEGEREGLQVCRGVLILGCPHFGV